MKKTKVFKPYKSLFENEKKSKADIFKEAKSKLLKVKKNLKALREEDEVEAEEVVDVLSTSIDQIEDVLTTIIDNSGATDPAVSTIINAVSSLEAQKDDAEFEVEMNDFSEAEEDDEEDEEEEEMTEAEESDEDEEETEEEDEKKEESVKKTKIKLSKYKK